MPLHPYYLTHLEYAVKNNDVALVKTLIAKGADPDERETCLVRTSLLRECIDENKVVMAEILIRGGANINKPDAILGHTPLYFAIRKGNLQMVKLFLDLGAAPTMKDLLEAILRHQLDIVRELIGRGVNVNSADGQTDFLMPIMRAVNIGNGDILQLLVDNGANVNAVDYRAETPLMKAVKRKNVSAVQYLIENKANVNARNMKNETALSMALANNDPLTFKFLIASGADPNLAKEAIAASARENPRFAAYMSALTKN